MKILNFSGLIIIFLIIGSPFCLIAEETESIINDSPISHIDSVLVKADSLFNSSKLSEAYELYNSVRYNILTECDTTSIYKLCSGLGHFFMKTNEFDSALFFFGHGLQLAKVSGNLDTIAFLGNLIGITYYKISDYDSSLKYLNMALDIAQETGDKENEATNLNNIGAVYADMGNFESALNYYKQALQIRREGGEKNSEGIYLNNIGQIYDYLADYNQALEYYEQSMKIAEELGNENQIATRFNNIGVVNINLGNYELALDYFENALLLSRKVEDTDLEATCLNNIGIVYDYLSQYKQALEYYENALDMRKKDGNKREQAMCFSNIGLIYYYLGDYNLSLEYLGQALDIAEEIGDRYNKAVILNNIGGIYDAISDYKVAISFYAQALEMARDIGDLKNEGVRLNNIGADYIHLGNYDEAFNYFQQALAIERKIGDKAWEGITLNNIGLVLDKLGDYKNAIEHYEQALRIAQETGNYSVIATCLNNIGDTYFSMCNFELALSYQGRALKIAQEIGNKDGEATYLSNIGNIFYKLRDYAHALTYFRQGLEISKEIGSKNSKAHCLRSIGDVYSDLGDKKRALPYFEQALKIEREIGDKKSESDILNSIGVLYYELGDYDNALPYYELALDLVRQIGAKSPESSIINNIAIIYENNGDCSRAHNYFHQSLKITRDIGNKEDEAITLGNIGLFWGFNKVCKHEDNEKYLDSALFYYKETIHSVEFLRDKINLYNQKAEYLEHFTSYYSSALDLSYRLFNKTNNIMYLNESFSYIESSRARTLLDQLAESKGNLREGIPDSLLEQERILMIRIGWLSAKLTEEKSKKVDDQDSILIEQLDSELMEKEEYLDRLQVTITKVSPRYSDLQYPEPMTLAQVQESLLDDSTAIIEYAISDSFGYVFCVTNDSFEVYKVPGAVELDKSVQMLRQLISNPMTLPRYDQFELLANKLYKVCIEPVEEIISNKPNLIIVADGPLCYVPFDVLLSDTMGNNWDNSSYLAEKKTIQYAPSATVLWQNRIHQKEYDGERLAFVGFGDPIYEDEILANNDSSRTSAVELAQRSAFGDSARGGLYRIRNTGVEVEDIADLFGKDLSQKYLRGDATETNVKANNNLAPYRYVHFACHGVLNENKPSYSGLVLSQTDTVENGYLQMYEIYNLDINADLVVLSACKTGMGKEIRGEGLIGLTRAFMYAGTPSVLVSLWSIDDIFTSAFMTEFYSKLKKKGKLESLHETQLLFINSDNYSHPYYWAPFIIMGEK